MNRVADRERWSGIRFPGSARTPWKERRYARNAGRSDFDPFHLADHRSIQRPQVLDSHGFTESAISTTSRSWPH